MMSTEDLGAIVGGCVVGGVVLLIVLIALVYMLCGKSKHRKRREQKKHRPISPHISPAHSQPSTFGHGHDPRLPKVNSTGLWIGAPSLYSGAPSPAYVYGGRPPHHIQRAASEARIPQPMPVGPQRIYHSQQLAPVYEMPPTRGMEIYDVYQFGGPGYDGPRSKLIETKHSQNYHNNHGEFRMGSRLERSKSDAQDRRGQRPDQVRASSRHSRTSSHDKGREPSARLQSSSQRSLVSEEKRSSKSMESVKVAGVAQRVKPEVAHNAHVNKGFAAEAAQGRGRAAPETSSPASSASSKSVIVSGSAGMVSAIVPGGGDNISPSATDSMKLLAKNKTDDQKTKPALASIMVEKKVDTKEDTGKELNHQHYTYQGDIYTMPSKNGIIKDNDYDNPILNRMKEMVIEKNRSNPTTARDDSVNPNETVNITTSTSSSNENGVYQEVTTVIKTTRSEVIEEVELDGDDSKKTGVKQDAITNKDISADLVLPDLDELENNQKKDRENPKASQKTDTNNTTQNSTNTSAATVKNEVEELSSPNELRIQTSLSPRGSIDDRDGKRIASAFEFLDTYLSDDEVTESHIESPPLSPGDFRVEGLVN